MEIVKIQDTLTPVEDSLLKTIVVAKNGIFEWKGSWLGKSLHKVNNYSSGIGEDKEEIVIINETVGPKLPKEALMSVINWYRSITLTTGKEAQINFYKKDKDYLIVNGINKPLTEIEGVKIWNDEIFSYVPLQNNHQAQTTVSSNDEYYNLFNEQFGMYIETHSHNSMSAFRSGTDEANSKFDGIQLVFGKLNTQEIEMHSWATVRDVQKNGLTDEELTRFIDLPTYSVKDGKLYFSEINLYEQYKTYEEEKWNDRIEKIVVHYPQYNKFSYYEEMFKLKGKKKVTKNDSADWTYPYYQSSFSSYESWDDFNSNYDYVSGYKHKTSHSYFTEDCISLCDLIEEDILIHGENSQFHVLSEILDIIGVVDVEISRDEFNKVKQLLDKCIPQQEKEI